MSTCERRSTATLYGGSVTHQPLSRLCIDAMKTKIASLKRDSSVMRAYPKPTVIPALETHSSSIFLLHGLGDSAAGWVSFGYDLGQALRHTKFILPTACQLPITLNGGMHMNGWSDLSSLEDINLNEDKDNLLSSSKYLAELVREEIAAGIDSRNIVVAGFSQGGAISLLSMRHDFQLAGVLSMSGYLTLSTKPLVSSANKGTPLLMCHGTADAVVYFKFGVAGYNKLKAAGANVTFNRYEGLGHSLCAEETEDIKHFLKKCLPSG